MLKPVVSSYGTNIQNTKLVEVLKQNEDLFRFYIFHDVLSIGLKDARYFLENIPDKLLRKTDVLEALADKVIPGQVLVDISTEADLLADMLPPRILTVLTDYLCQVRDTFSEGEVSLILAGFSHNPDGSLLCIIKKHHRLTELWNYLEKRKVLFDSILG